MSEFSHLPVIQIQGRRSGKTLLVTAGMDGDEYAGIEAAGRLAEKFRATDFGGRLIIVPTVNLDGYRAHTSSNPLDRKFPKSIFPGRADGSDSERLVYWLSHEHVAAADAWIDLHGGASDEHLNPFLWLYKTGVPKVDKLNQAFIERSSSRLLLTRAGFFSKAKRLARLGKWYLMAEAGELGLVDEAAVTQHLRWIELGMQTLRMIRVVVDPAVTNTEMRIYSRLQKKQTLDPADRQHLLWWREGGPYFIGRL